MHVATLITDPANPALSPALVADLRTRWGAAEPRWLAEGEAAELPLPALPADADQAWAELQTHGVDLALQPAEGRRKRLLLADMDSTMIGQECIDELADMAGIGPQIAAVTARAMNGELAFEPALRERVALLRGLDAGVIDQVLAERITCTPGGRELVATMRANGATCVLVSGGFTAFTAAVTAWLGFDSHRANLLEVEDGRLTGRVAEPILGRAAKRDALEDYCTRLAITPADVIAIGDGANDLDMLTAAGMGIAMHAKPSVAAACRLRIHHGDLTAALYLQGYTRAEFAA